MSEILDVVEPYIPGPQGKGGTIKSATAKGLAAGAQPTVKLGGTPEERTIEFGIPKGDSGTPSTITEATAETLPPQSQVTVTMGGTPSARTLKFGIPKGDPGAGSVSSVNGKLGPDVVLSAADVGAETPGGVDSKLAAAIGALPKTDLVPAIRYPLYIAHRGSPRVYPEHSIEAYRASYAAGFTPEADVRALADGTLVCIHDATTNATMNVSKTVSAMTVAEWRAASIKPPKQGDRIVGSGVGTPVFFEDYLDEFGGKIALFPEIKVTGAPATAAIQAIVKRGLQGSVVLQSGDFATCKAAADAGLHTLLLSNTQTPASMVAAGIMFVGVSSAATNAYVTQCKAAGMRVIAWTMNTKAEADAQLARGADGVFSDDPWEVSRLYTPSTSLDLSQGYLAPGMLHARNNSGSNVTGTTQVVKVENGTLLFTQGNESIPNCLKLGSLGQNLGGSVTVRLWVQAVSRPAASSEGNWLFGVYLGKQTDDGAVNEEPNGSQFRLAMVRRNGQKAGYEKRTMTGTITNLGTVPTTNPPYAKDGGRSVPMLFEIEFTPTALRIRNITLNDTDLEVTATALTVPGAYLTLNVNGAVSRVWGVEAFTP